MTYKSPAVSELLKKETGIGRAPKSRLWIANAAALSTFDSNVGWIRRCLHRTQYNSTENDIVKRGYIAKAEPIYDEAEACSWRMGCC